MPWERQANVAHQSTHLNTGARLSPFRSLPSCSLPLPLFAGALQQDPSLAVGWNNLGCVVLDEGNPQEAINHFSRAVYHDECLECAYSNLVNVMGQNLAAVALINLANRMRDEGAWGRANRPRGGIVCACVCVREPSINTPASFKFPL